MNVRSDWVCWRTECGPLQNLSSGGENQANDGEETQAARGRHLWGEVELGSAMLSVRPAQGSNPRPRGGSCRPPPTLSRHLWLQGPPARAKSWLQGQREGLRTGGPQPPPPSSLCRSPKRTGSIRSNRAFNSSHCTEPPLTQRSTYLPALTPQGTEERSGAQE